MMFSHHTIAHAGRMRALSTRAGSPACLRHKKANNQPAGDADGDENADDAYPE